MIGKFEEFLEEVYHPNKNLDFLVIINNPNIQEAHHCLVIGAVNHIILPATSIDVLTIIQKYF